MADITADINTRAGSGTVTISHSSLTATSMEVEDIGTVGVEFDLESSKDTQNSIFFTPTEFKFTVWNQLDNGDYLFDYFDAISVNDEITVSLDFTTDGGLNFVDEYTFNKKDIQYRATQRKLTIEANIDADSSATIGDIFTNYPSDVYDHENSDSVDTALQVMPAKFFIENYFDHINPNNTFVNQSRNYRLDPFSTVFSGDFPYVISVLEPEKEDQYIREFNSPYKLNRSASNALYRLSAIDGSVVGSLLGYSFISHRLDDTNIVSITNDDVEDYDVSFGIKNHRILQALIEKIPIKYNSVPSAISFTDQGALLSAYSLTDSDNTVKYGAKELSIYFQINELTACQWDTNDLNFYSEGSNDQDATIDNMYSLLGTVSVDKSEGAYTIAYSEDGSAPTISAGDMICIGQTTGQIHTVIESLEGSLEFYSPLRDSVDSGTEIYKVVEIAPSALNPLEADDMVEYALRAYAHAFGANGAREAEFIIWDIDKIRPYSKIQLDGSFTENAINNKKFSPSKLKYNLETDKITFTGYEIP